jgi:outer membrane murein-binding lipoprotein Lpp
MLGDIKMKVKLFKIFAVILLPMLVSGCASNPSPNAKVSATPSSIVDGSTVDSVPAELADLQAALADLEDPLTGVVVDDSGYFKNVQGYVGALKLAKDCNLALFDSSQLAFNARYGLGAYNFEVSSGSFKDYGAVVYSMRDSLGCAKSIGGAVNLWDQNVNANAKGTWVARLSAIEDCWKNHIVCLTSKSLSYPSGAIDPMPLRLDGIGKLVDEGYCVVSGFDPHEWETPGFMACNASNGKNVLGAVGSTYVLNIVASTSDGFASKVIAGDGWVIAFESGFTDSDINKALEITGGKLIAR